jgi:REP element-mobilizing transposase RayT
MISKFILAAKIINMSTYTQILYQLVFGTKDHIPFLSRENESILFGYIAGILKNKSCHSYIVGGASNHIHIITHVHPTLAPAFLIKDIKIASHKMSAGKLDTADLLTTSLQSLILYTMLKTNENIIKSVLSNKSWRNC